MENNFKKNFIWNILGLTFNSFNSLFFLIIVKYINGINIAGMFTYAFSICCLFYIISTYYNRAYQISNYNEYNLNDYLSSRIIFSIICFVLLLIFSLISSFNLYKIVIIMLLMIFRIVESISDCLYGEIQKKGNLYKTGISLTLKSIFGLIAFLIIDLLTKNIIFSILGLILINILFLILYDTNNIELHKIKFKTNKIISIVKNTFPIFIFSFLGIYLANCQKYVLTYFADNTIQTIFGILIMPATLLCLAGNYLILPYITILSDLYKNKKNKEFIKLSFKLFIILLIFGVLCVVICYFIGIPFLNFIYHMNFEKYKWLLIIIIIASIFYAFSMVLSNILTILNINKIQSIIYLISSFISTIISIVLINNFSITGAVYSYLISFVINASIYFIVVIKKFKKMN